MKKYKLIDDIQYEEVGPYCELCNAHMGQYYAMGAPAGKCIINPLNYEDYGCNICSECGTKYTYNEGNMIELTDEDKAALLALREMIKHD